jgi:hypothetical protein
LLGSSLQAGASRQSIDKIDQLADFAGTDCDGLLGASHLVDDQQPGGDPGAMSDERTFDCGIEPQRDWPLQTRQKPRAIEPFGHDCDKPTAGRQTVPGRPQVARAGATIVPSLDAVRIGRIHQDDAGNDGWIEQLVDQFGVMAAHSGRREQGAQAVAAQRRDFVEGKARAGLGGPDREHARSGRGFQHRLVSGQRAGSSSKPGKARRRRKLLPFDLLVAAIGLGRQSGIEGAEELFRLVDRRREQNLIRCSQVLNLCQLKRCMGVTNGPTPESIAASEVLRHDARGVAA